MGSELPKSALNGPSSLSRKVWRGLTLSIAGGAFLQFFFGACANDLSKKTSFSFLSHWLERRHTFGDTEPARTSLFIGDGGSWARAQRGTRKIRTEALDVGTRRVCWIYLAPSSQNPVLQLVDRCSPILRGRIVMRETSRPAGTRRRA